VSFYEGAATIEVFEDGQWRPVVGRHVGNGKVRLRGPYAAWRNVPAEFDGASLTILRNSPEVVSVRTSDGKVTTLHRS